MPAAVVADPGRPLAGGDRARLLELPRRAVAWAEDETHLHLLPHIQASWTRRGRHPHIPTPGKNRRVTSPWLPPVTSRTSG